MQIQFMRFGKWINEPGQACQIAINGKMHAMARSQSQDKTPGLQKIPEPRRLDHKNVFHVWIHTVIIALPKIFSYTFSSMISSHSFPLFMSLADKHCVVAGLGEVGARKTENLLACGAGSILALDIKPVTGICAQGRSLLRDQRITFASRAFRPEDCANATLVFATTSDAAENRRIAAICRKARVLCNCATDPECGDFILPATARQGQLCAALSTAGQSPLLARQWRMELEEWLKPREKLAWLMGRLRAPVLALGCTAAFNAAFFRKIAESPIAHWLEHADIAPCRDWLLAELPPEMQSEIDNILADYATIFA